MELGAVELGATFADAHSILKIGDIPHAYLLCWLRFYKSKALALECQIVICVLDQQPCTPRSNRPNFGNRGPANRCDNVLHTRRMFDIKRCIPYSAFAHLLVGLAHGNNFKSNCLKVSTGLCHVPLLFIDYSSLSVSDRFIRVAEYHFYGRTRMPYAGHMS